MNLKIVTLFRNLLCNFSFDDFSYIGKTVMDQEDVARGKYEDMKFPFDDYNKSEANYFILLEANSKIKIKNKNISYKLFAIPVMVDVPDEDTGKILMFPRVNAYPLINEDFLIGEHNKKRPEVHIGYREQYVASVYDIVKPKTDNWWLWFSYCQEIFVATCKANYDHVLQSLEDTLKQKLCLNWSMVSPKEDSAIALISALYYSLLTDGEEAWENSTLNRAVSSIHDSIDSLKLADNWYCNVLSKGCSYLLGHMDEQESNLKDNKLRNRSLNPLDNTQRQVVISNGMVDNSHYSTPILAVNGPPGSEKTAMLKSVVAHEWVKAALEQANCPIIMAVGATNQAATNVISAFSNVPHKNEDSDSMLLYTRWIKVCPSYGSYFSSKSFLTSKKEKDIETKKLYVVAKTASPNIPALFEWIDDNGYLSNPKNIYEIESYYLEKAKTYFDNSNFKIDKINLNNVIDCLHNILEYTAKNMSACKAEMNKAINDNNIELIYTKVKNNQHPQIKSVIDKLIILMRREDALDIVKEVCREKIKDENIDDDCISDHMPTLINESITILIEHYLDIEFRSKLFHISARYWEGRYILTNMNSILLSRTKDNVIDGLRRLCMITPCLVSTIHSAPRAFSISATLAGEKVIQYAYSSIDCLIIDETGQASIHLCLPLLSLAKKTIAVGDIKQLQPVIKNITELQEQLQFKSMGFDDKSYSKLYTNGLTATNGSMLHLARSCSTLSYQDQGLMLRGHYRCQTKIISLCNNMVYDGKLFFLKIKSKEAGFFPPMTWVDSKSKSQSFDGSRINSEEANLIVSFIIERWPEYVEFILKKKSFPTNADQIKISDYFAIVTPYNKQAELIKKTFKNKLSIQHQRSTPQHLINENDLKNLVIGTVDSLQGAEKEVVIFSSVRSAADGGNPHFSEQPFLINVAVSRAKESFISFVCPILYGIYTSKDISISMKNDSIKYLGCYLGKNGKRLFPNKLVIIEAPGKINDIKSVLGSDYECIATGGSIHKLGLEKSALSSRSGLRPKYSLTSKGEQIIQEIVESAKYVDNIYLATDDDYVGEAIAWHLSSHLIKKLPELKDKLSRIRLRAMTDNSIKEAFDNPMEIDKNRVSAEITREISDILIARKLFKVINENKSNFKHYNNIISKATELNIISNKSKSNKKTKGIGRVKSGVLHLLLEKVELEISRANKAKDIQAHLHVNGKTFVGNLFDNTGIISNQISSSQKISHDLWKHSMTDEEIEEVYPISSSTVEILQQAWKQFRLKPIEVMQALQFLYEGSFNEK